LVAALLLVGGAAVGYAVMQGSEPEQAAPPPLKPMRVNWSDGTELAVTPSTKLLVEQAKRELDGVGISDEVLSRKGYTIDLTIDKAAQERGERILDETRRRQPTNLRMALVAVDPQTGRIVAWNGYQPEKAEFDYTRAWQNPGGTFLPFGLVALLHNGKGLGEVYDGSSPRKFGQNCEKPNTKACSVVNNSATANACGKHCSVARAMELSVNTVFTDIAYNDVGTKAVAKAAIEAGIPANFGAKQIPLEGGNAAPDINIAIGGGDYQARPSDIAGAYATFAANGIKRTPHLVAKVTDPEAKNVVLDQDAAQAGGARAFSPADPETNAKIARNVTESLLPAAAAFPCTGNRPCAAKPGVNGCSAVAGKTEKADNCISWMAGYTPQLSTAVWLGTDDTTALRDLAGAPLDSTLPAQAWQKFMNEQLNGVPVEQFPPYVPIGKSPSEAQIPPGR
jgi:membrane peptidoglycan carboxypeptidase